MLGMFEIKGNSLKWLKICLLVIKNTLNIFLHDINYCLNIVLPLFTHTNLNIFFYCGMCLYRLVMMSIDLSKKLTPHVQMVTGSVDIKVAQLLHYHMLLLYCM